MVGYVTGKVEITGKDDYKMVEDWLFSVDTEYDVEKMSLHFLDRIEYYVAITRAWHEGDSIKVTFDNDFSKYNGIRNCKIIKDADDDMGYSTYIAKLNINIRKIEEMMERKKAAAEEKEAAVGFIIDDEGIKSDMIDS